MRLLRPSKKPCRNAKRYKGFRPPRCSGGAGCFACIDKWVERTKGLVNGC
jgi:hypothetical protein